MVRRDGGAIRHERMKEMATFIHRQLERDPETPTISLSKTVAHFQYEIGLRLEKVLEYLKILEKLEHFTIDEEADLIKKTTAS